MSSIDQAEIERARAEYRENGATVLRGVISRDWINRLSDAIDAMMSGGHGEDYADGAGGRFFHDLFSWLHEPELEKFIRESNVAELAGQIMNAKEVRFFYDQLLVKEPGTGKRTPWHQDLPYWPASGEDVISFWAPIDPAGPENGVVTYVKGSHRWNRFFPMQPFAEGYRADLEEEAAQFNNIYDNADAKGRFGSLADIRDNPDKYEFLSWSVEPGDVIVHHPLVIHGAGGNLSTSSRRRAFSTRWFGDDARWDSSRPHFMRAFKRVEGFPYPKLEQGAEMDDPLFPIIWKRAA